MVAPIEANTWTIGGFLSAHQASIPELQRPYAWERGEAEDLVNDLRNIVDQILKSDPDDASVAQHFFGTIVLLNVAVFSPVIDGQQRLTTVTALLSIIEHAFKQVASEAQHVGAPDQVAANCLQMATEIHGKLWVAGPMDSKGRLVSEPRLRVSPEISKTYQNALEGGELTIKPGLPEAAIHLIENLEFFDKQFVRDDRYFKGEPVKKFRYLHAVYRAVSSGLIIVSLKTQSANAGYDLFESLNARGVDLNVLDLLKVWIMSRLSEENCPKGLITEAAASLEKLSSGEVTFQKEFFELYFRARAQLNIKKDASPKGLALETRRLIFNDPTLHGKPDVLSIYERIMAELARMDIWSPIAKELRPLWSPIGRNIQSLGNPAPSSIQWASPSDRLWASRRILHLNKTLGNKGVLFPLLLIASDKLRNDPSRFIDLIHLLEKFFFRYKTMCGGPEKKIEEAYYGFIRILEANGTIDLNLVRNTLNGLIQTHANDVKFSQRMNEKLIYGKRPLVRYALHTLHLYGLPPNPRRDPADLSNWWLEHIAPQNPSGSPAVSPDLIHSLGNLCLLDPAINQKLSNMTFDAKKKAVQELRQQNKNIDVHDTLLVFSNGQKSWTDDDVQKRQQRLIQRLIQIYTL